MAKIKVLISTSKFGAEDSSALKKLQLNKIDVVKNNFGRTLTEAETKELVRDVNGLIAGTEPITASVLAEAPQLKVVSRVGVGLDNVDLEAARSRGIVVFNTPDVVTKVVAEFAIGGLLTLLRHHHRMDAELRLGQWSKMSGWQLEGKTVGILGLGRIGRRVAELLKPFDVQLLAHDVAPDFAWAQLHGVRIVDSRSLFAQSDIVMIHASKEKKEKSSSFLCGREQLALMKPGSFLVNVARGGLVDEVALYQALREGLLAGAFLDVFEQEPYAGPLRGLSNVLLTPHAATHAREARFRMEMAAVDNLLSVLKGRAS